MNLKQTLRKVVNEELNRKIKSNRLIEATAVNGRTIINVDIQPEYKSYITFNITDWAKYLNRSAKNNRIVFLYNGADTLGMVSEQDYRSWLIEHGVRITDNAVFYDKGYAFFRYCMDNSIDEQNIADFVKFMIANNINDSRDIDQQLWDSYMQQTGHDQQDVRDLLENAGDMIHIPELIDFLNPYSNIVLTGGGVNECLKEVEIALLAMDKPFTILNDFTY